jgi:hypothetical protein
MENNGTKELEHYPLDDCAIETIGPLTQQIQTLQTALNAILSYILKQQKLQGNWRLAANGRELVKETTEQTVA